VEGNAAGEALLLADPLSMLLPLKGTCALLLLLPLLPLVPLPLLLLLPLLLMG
jgi:hypothetical protein